MKKVISVPVGCEPTLQKHHYRNENYIHYGYGISLYPTSNLESLVKELSGYLKKYSKEYTNLRFQEKRDCGCYHDCNCSPSYILYGEREETDLEYNFRLEEEAKKEAWRRENERRQYEELKKKFENG